MPSAAIHDAHPVRSHAHAYTQLRSLQHLTAASPSSSPPAASSPSTAPPDHSLISTALFSLLPQVDPPPHCTPSFRFKTSPNCLCTPSLFISLQLLARLSPSSIDLRLFNEHYVVKVNRKPQPRKTTNRKPQAAAQPSAATGELCGIQLAP
jgi:hypothetical protein